MPKRILLTGARAPFTLGLARQLHNAGDIVYATDSVRFPVCRFSNSVTEYIRLPSPRFKQGEYIEKLVTIITEKRIDVLIPTCEELFYIARHRKLFPPSCKIWIDTIEQLESLHNKYLFIENMRGLGLPVPQTRLLSSKKDLDNFCKDPFSVKSIFKPAYSRFASKTVIWDSGAVPPDIEPTGTVPWLAQDYIEGREICTYGLAQDGQLLAHATYPPQQRWGLGASTVFTHEDNPAALAWVQKTIQKLNFSGQIAFDFIDKGGTLYPIECNPRSTSGIHLFGDTPAFARQLKAPGAPLVVPGNKKVYAMKFPLFLTLFTPQPVQEKIAALRILRSGTDVIWDRRDAGALWGELVSMGEFLLQSIRLTISANESSSHDIDYNGKDESL